MADRHNKTTTFSEFNLHPAILDALEDARFTQATPLQATLLPLTQSGKDILGISPRGSGKTAAYLIAVLNYLMQTPVAPEAKGPWALILLPSEKFLNTLKRNLSLLAKYTGLNTLVAYSRANLENQCKLFQENDCDIVIATPKRLQQLLEAGALSLDNIDSLVIDGLQGMVNSSQIELLESLLQQLPPSAERFNLLFSNKLTPEVKSITETYFNSPEILSTEEEVAEEAVAEPVTIDEHLYRMKDFEKTPLLIGLLNKFSPTRTLVFAKNKEDLARLAAICSSNGHATLVLKNPVGNKHRDALKRKIETDNPRIILTTDNAARGVVFTDIDCVVDYDLPTIAEDYTQRSARLNKSGPHISFASEDFSSALPEIEHFIGHELALQPLDADLLADIMPPTQEALAQVNYIDLRDTKTHKSANGKKPFKGKKKPRFNKARHQKNYANKQPFSNPSVQ